MLKIASIALPLLIIVGCSSATSGHAPGLAGGQTLNPSISNYPLAYVKRPVPVKDIDVRDLITMTPGGDLYVRDEANASGVETNVTQSLTQGMGDVRDLDVSPDGKRVVFALHVPLIANATPDQQTTWNLYEYDSASKTVRQVTDDSITRGDDIGPHYLPDGRIVFASDRQTTTQAILLDEGRPQYQAQTDDRKQAIFELHVVNADGSAMHQISFNTNHDFAPSVLSNGQIVFSRWEVTAGADQISLYRANPDGTGLELYYGANSHATGASIGGTGTNVIQFLDARQRSDGKLIAIARPFLGTQLGGDILVIDAEHFVENNQATLAAAGTNGPAQSSATTLGVTTDANLPSPGGRFASAYPLYDGSNRMLVSWSPCLVLDQTQTPPASVICNGSNDVGANVLMAPPQYTVWLYDFDTGTMTPVLGTTPGMMVVDPVILQPRTPPPTYLPDSVPSTSAALKMAANGVGLLDISSVYDFDGKDTAQPSIAGISDPTQAGFYTRPYRFIRIVKAVEIPDKTVRKINNSAFGPAGMGMREILGYAPIQPDGSVQIQVPANVPFTIDIVDANARRVIARHTSWLQLMPGETKSCNGCHTATGQTSHGRAGLFAAVNAGAPTTGQPFPNTNPNLFANAGETMAQTLARISCASGSMMTCSQVLSSDVIYTNLWTTGVTLPPGDQDNSFSYLYANGGTPPTNANCSPWAAQCRATIHYASALSPTQLYIQSIWNLTRPPMMVNGVTATACVGCHTTIDAQNNALQVPAGQLDLTGGASSLDPTVVTGYEQLLFPHNEQTLNMGVLQDVLVPAPGPPDPVTGLPTTVMVPVALPPPMSAGSANASAAFYSVFNTGGDHNGFLTPAELRLVSEWLDIGGQYYNDPFVAPAAP